MDQISLRESLLQDHQKFNDFVYISLDQALSELEKRRHNKELEKYVDKLLPHGVPSIMKGKKNMVLFRHIATSNHEISRFAIIADVLTELTPLILEYREDKFNNRNEWKYFLGKLHFHKNINKKGEQIFESVTIIDFNKSNNQPMSLIKSLWGQSLIDFHHELFEESYPHLKNNVLDFSTWLHDIGPYAKDYYKPFLALFIRDGILFENFLLETKELIFTREIILPAIFEILEETGVKPLIVALEPTDIEGDKFWLSHPYHKKLSVERKMKGLL